MANEKGLRLVHRAQQAFNSEERKNAETLWQDLYKYVLVNQNSNVSNQGVNTSKGLSTTKDVMDSTAIRANQELSAAIFSTMTPPTSKWCKFRHKDMELNNNSNVSTYMEEAAQAVLNEFAESNLYIQLGSNFPSFTALGTMALLHEEKPPRRDGSYGGVRFTALHLSQIAWEENADGIVDSLYRRFTMTPAQMMDRFESVPRYVHDRLQQAPHEPLTIFHCIMPRRAYGSASITTGEDKPYASYYVEEKEANVLEESGYDEFPAYIVRKETMPGEVIGRGFGHIALPDIKQLNSRVAAMNRAEALAIEPPVITTQSAVLSNAIDLRPGGNTVVSRMDGIQFVQSNARFDVTAATIERLVASINSTFLIDKILLPPRTQTGEMTAYEVAQRVEQMQRVLGAVPNRIIAEMLTPMILRQYRIMERRGALPPLPAELEGDDMDVELVYVNQLSRAQSIEEVSAIQQWSQWMAGMAQLHPEVIDTMNVDETSRHVARVYGAPEQTIAADDDIQETRDQRNQVQQAQIQADLNLKQADAQSKQV